MFKATVPTAWRPCLYPVCCLLVAVTVQVQRVMSKSHPWRWGAVTPSFLSWGRSSCSYFWLQASGLYWITQQFPESSCGMWRLTKHIWIWTTCKSLQIKIFLLLAVTLVLGWFSWAYRQGWVFLLFTFWKFCFFNSDYFSDLYDQLTLKRLCTQCSNLCL